MRRVLAKTLRVALPFMLGAAILYWMYRGSSWDDIRHMLLHRMNWGWMLASLLFGVIPQVLRGLRWRIALDPTGEHPRRRTCVLAIFVSYAASLIVPRVGEITRCGTLSHHDGTSFAKGLGTVVSERIVDALFMALATVAVIISQRGIFSEFVDSTGTNMGGIFRGLTATGCLVAAACLVALVAICVAAVRRMRALAKVRDVLHNLWEGVVSLGRMRRPGHYLLLSAAIWVCYYLHFSLTLYCFDFTSGLSQTDALAIFCAGTYAVLIPTPNGAGPWHFAVKTMLVLYGIAAGDAILFALVVHTMQTALIILLGVAGLAGLQLLPRRGQAGAMAHGKKTMC